jgi:RNA polymerase sigma-70 factor, ECF subfamily
VNAVAVRSDEALYDALRAGDEQAFTVLVERYHSSLVRLAMVYVKNRSVAEEVAQETWLGVIRGLERFESRSLLKTWIFRILTNKAKTRAHRESRSVPFSSLAPADGGDSGPTVEPERFLDASHPVWPGHWASPPRSWNDVPEARLVSKETRAVIEAAIESLPRVQAQVITLRDIEGWSPEEVCNALAITDANQRVLLHRARAKVRAELERYLD